MDAALIVLAIGKHIDVVAGYIRADKLGERLEARRLRAVHWLAIAVVTGRKPQVLITTGAYQVVERAGATLASNQRT